MKYIDPDGRSDVCSKEFFAYTMGSNIAELANNAKIISTSGDRGSSMPWGTIRIPVNDSYQGGYNPTRHSGPSQTGRIGLETHELWHQVQYKQSGLSFFKLIIEQIGYFFGISDPYLKGDPKRNPSILSSIETLWNIPTLEGQAQFVGQWNADVNEYLSGGDVDMDRLKQEAQIILKSGFDSQAARDILALLKKEEE